MQPSVPVNQDTAASRLLRSLNGDGKFGLTLLLALGLLLLPLLGGDSLRLAAIGLTNEPRLLDPADPLGDLPGLEQTGWKRELAGVLCERALARVSSG